MSSRLRDRLERSGLLEELETGPILAAHRAAERLRRGATPLPPVAALRRAFERGDGLARLLLLHVLAAAGDSRAVAGALGSERGAERMHAAWALGSLPPVPRAAAALEALRAEPGPAALAARLTLERWRGRRLVASAPLRPAGGRLRVAQVVLRGRLDAGLTQAGGGDGGGVATLAVQLATELGRLPAIERSYLLAGALAGGPRGLEPLGDRASIVRVGGPGFPFDLDGRLESELVTTFQALRLDAVHLRFAEGRTLAAARAAVRAGVPIVFTLAPDPHRPIAAAERAGTLTRASFAAADEREQLVFRLRLLEWLARRADRVVVLPGTAPGELADLLGGLPPAPIDVVPEGIAPPADGPRSVEGLDRLPPGRRGLPLLVSVGRLHAVKGFPRLVEAWAGDPELFRSFNLVVAGGDLADPSEDERAELAAIEEVLRRRPQARDGLLLLGARPHAEVAALQRLARIGEPGVAAPGGVYACASLKEEFGLAVLEALGAGLAVVAPSVGGPPTYVEDGVTGALVEPGSVEALRTGIRRAAELRLDEQRARRAERLVRERFALRPVAEALAGVYAGAGAGETAAAAA